VVVMRVRDDHLQAAPIIVWDNRHRSPLLSRPSHHVNAA
jgi:hypothetical protein